MHMGEKLKKYVLSNYANQSDFARVIESSPQLLHSYFKRENIKYSTITRIASKLNMEAGQLMAALEAIE